MGGEPLLYPELYKVISFLLKSEKIGIIEIVTNGTISLGEDIQSLFPSKKLNIYVSNYGELSRKLNEYISNSKINRTIANKDGYWKDHGGFSYQGKGIEELKKQFKKCSKDKCVLFQGKLYSCACAAFGSDLGVFKLEKDEFVDLRNSGSERSSITNNCEIEENSKLSQQLLAFKKRGFFTSCNYCYWGTDLFTDIEVAKQVKK